jgi:hypothetical protein
MKMMIARVKPIFIVLEPTTLPIIISLKPLNEELMELANSGMDVANATNVNPMTRSDMPNFFAILDAAGMNKEEPNIRMTRPMKKTSRFSIILADIHPSDKIGYTNIQKAILIYKSFYCGI